MEVLFSFFVASVLLTLSPGPDLLMVIAQSIEKGAYTAWWFVLGLLTGLLVHTSLLILGWAQFIGERPHVVGLIKWFGFIYFSFLGLKSTVAFINKKDKNPTAKLNATKSSFLQGVLMNGINPKVSLFFWLFFPGFLFSDSLPIALQYAVLGCLFIVQATVVFGGVIFFANQFSHFFSRYRFGLVSGLLWLFLAVYLVVD